jgi:hypothetical protein
MTDATGRVGGPAGGAQSADAAPTARTDATARRVEPVLVVLFGGLVLYAALGKGFAYAGWPPLFVGEVLLALVLLATWHANAAVPRNIPAAVTAGLVGIAAIQVTVDVLDGGHELIEIARGVAPITYAAFAFGMYALLRRWEGGAGRRQVLATIDATVARLVPLIIATLAVLASVLLTGTTWGPRWPGSGVPMLLTKPGDIAVTVVLVAPYVLRATASGRPVARRRLMFGLWVAVSLLISFRSRGALLALAAGLLVARPRPERVLRMVVAVGVLLFVLYLTGVTVRAGNREISYQEVGRIVTSIVDSDAEDAPGSNLVGTRHFRTDWWGAIWDDALQRPMLVTGNGWGDNLTLRYHGQSEERADDPRALRSPHDIFFSLVGRAGLITAFAFVFVPLATVWRALARPGAGRDLRIVEGVRGAVVASLTTALADVYLESPQGAILYWSLIGFLWWVTADPVQVDA